MDSLVLQSLLMDNQLDWRVHNCKLIQHSIDYDLPLSFLSQYDTLEDDIKEQIPLTRTLLRHINDKLTVHQTAQILGVDEKLLKKAWHIKYIGRTVVFSHQLSLAVRFYFSNTAKSAQTVYVPNAKDALCHEIEQWQAFGVVDVLYKSSVPLVSAQEDVLTIESFEAYQSLPSAHSLGVLALINTHKNELYFCQAISDVISATVRHLADE